MRLENNTITAQTIDVRGKVLDQDGNPLLANVIIEGTAMGVITDFDGNFYFPNVPPNLMLEFSFQGNIVKKAASESIGITTINTENQLDEVVINYEKPNKLKNILLVLGLTGLILVLSNNEQEPIKVEL